MTCEDHYVGYGDKLVIQSISPCTSSLIIQIIEFEKSWVIFDLLQRIRNVLNNSKSLTLFACKLHSKSGNALQINMEGKNCTTLV